MEKTKNFTEGRILIPLIGFMLPVLLALFLQAMYGAVDLMVVGRYADTADVSGVATGSQLMMTVTTVITGLAMGATVLIGQKIGAGKPERARKALMYGIGTSLLAGMVIGYLSFFHGDVLAGFFARETQVVAAAADYLRAYAIDCFLTAFLFCFIGYFSGMGRTVFVMLQGLAGAFLVRIPVSFFVSRIAGVSLFYIGLATPASTLVQIALCAAYMLFLNRRQAQGIHSV